MRIPVGIDITETWEVDFCAEAGRQAVATWRAALEQAEKLDPPEPGKVETARAGLAAAEADLASYIPGSGPVVILGHIPGAKRAEIVGLLTDAGKAAERDRFAGEQAWRREVVRWGLRGHRGMKTRAGVEQAFDGETATIAGERLTIATERQVERYVQAGMLGDLASIVLAGQGVTEAGKNA